MKWFDVYHREWNVPHFILDIPFCYEEQKKEELDYIVNQFKDLIKTIEEMSGQKFDIDKLQKERQRLSDNEVRQKIAQLSKGRIAKKGIGKMADGGYPDGTKKLEIKVGGIGYNNPSDPMTREKLKVILRKDAFGFSEKERSVLGKILKDSQ